MTHTPYQPSYCLTGKRASARFDDGRFPGHDAENPKRFRVIHDARATYAIIVRNSRRVTEHGYTVLGKIERMTDGYWWEDLGGVRNGPHRSLSVALRLFANMMRYRRRQNAARGERT